MIDYEIRDKTEYPRDGPTQMIKRTVAIEVEGQVYKRKFNLEPGQEVEPFVKRFEKDIRKAREQYSD